MSFHEAFPRKILLEIAEYPGNDKCCDCSSRDTDWCSLSHGTLICLECAGRHRSLGVQVSFVRSIRMDSWSKPQIEMMRQGGNDQIRKFFAKLRIENEPIHKLYCTKGAKYYRERLKERVDKILSGEITLQKRINHSSTGSGNGNVREEERIMVTSSQSSRDSRENHANKPSKHTFVVVFGEGTMGMTITKDHRELALVSKLIPGGAAQLNGVKVGDYVIGVSGEATDRYDDIMERIPSVKRPLEIKFSRFVNVPAQLIRGLHTSRSEPTFLKFLECTESLDSNANSSIGHDSDESEGDTIPISNAEGKSNSTGITIVSLPFYSGQAEDYVTKLHSNGVKASQETDKEGTQTDRETEVNNGIKDDGKDGESSAARRKATLSFRLEIGVPIKVYSLQSRADSSNSNIVSDTSRFDPESQNNNLPKAWLDAVLKQKHRDGTFKVLYSDGSTESHVSLDRLALPKDSSLLKHFQSSTLNAISTGEQNLLLLNAANSPIRKTKERDFYLQNADGALLRSNSDLAILEAFDESYSNNHELINALRPFLVTTSSGDESYEDEDGYSSAVKINEIELEK